MKVTFSITTTLAILIMMGSVHAAGDPAAGKEKSAACVACHGVDGNSPNGQWPKIAGQHAQYIVKQLKDYKSGKRKNAIMVGMAAALSDQDMEDLAAYYQSQNLKRGGANADLVALGESIYRGGNLTTNVTACVACHNPNGAGNPMANFPAISGQHAQYIADQLRYFKGGQRANDLNRMMRNVAVRMSEEEIEAVASYIQGLR